MRSVTVRVVMLALLLFFALASVISLRIVNRLPDSIVYFVRDEGDYFRLEPAGRRSEEPTLERSLYQAVQALREGVTEAESARGLHSAIPTTLTVYALHIDDSVVHVDISNDFAQGGGTAMLQARLYQLLYTLSQPRDIDAVQLSIEGQPATLLGGEGLLLDSPWRRHLEPSALRW